LRAENRLKARRFRRFERAEYVSRVEVSGSQARSSKSNACLTHLDIYLSVRYGAACPNKGDHIWTNDVRVRVLDANAESASPAWLARSSLSLLPGKLRVAQPELESKRSSSLRTRRRADFDQRGKKRRHKPRERTINVEALALIVRHVSKILIALHQQLIPRARARARPCLRKRDFGLSGILISSPRQSIQFIIINCPRPPECKAKQTLCQTVASWRKSAAGFASFLRLKGGDYSRRGREFSLQSIPIAPDRINCEVQGRPRTSWSRALRDILPRFIRLRIHRARARIESIGH